MLPGSESTARPTFTYEIPARLAAEAGIKSETLDHLAAAEEVA